MVLNAAQTKLFVVAANSDELIIINTATNAVVAQVNASAPTGVLGHGKYVPKGSNPNRVALSPDESTAYVTDGGTNAVAVVSLTGKAPVDVESGTIRTDADRIGIPAGGDEARNDLLHRGFAYRTQVDPSCGF